MKQLFANNAKAILVGAINSSDTAITVDNGSLFPAPGAYEYFMVTLELAGVIEVVMITGRAGNVLTVGGLGRGCENTTASAFSGGARVEVRVTRDSLDRKSTQLYPINSLDNVISPKASYSAGYVATNSQDPFGNPAILFAKSLDVWRFFNYTSIGTYTITGATTTSATATSIILNALTAGKYVVQFLSGTYVGQIRTITSVGSNTINWTTALSGIPTNGTTFEILEANISMLQDAILAVALPVAINSGTTNALGAVYFPVMTGYSDNQILGVVLTTPNTSGTVTFAPNALTPKEIVGRTGGGISPGDLSGTILLRYDVGLDKWVLVSGGSGGLTSLSFYLGNL